MGRLEKKLAEMGHGRSEKDIDLARITRDDIAKAKAHVHAEESAPQRFTHDGIHIDVHGVRVEHDLLRVDLTASVPVRGPFLFANPPLQVERGTDDPPAAFREMVGRAVAWAIAQEARR